MQKSKATPLISLDSKEKEEEYKKSVAEKLRQIYEGEKLTEIDEDSVFYGFTEFVSSGIIKMDSSDMMVEHGKGHLETNSSHCRLRSSEDLAYWTNPDYWNEVLQKRKETDVNKANRLRNQKGTDRMQPSCIVCFDENINEQSLLAARIHNIPILMIDRQAYLDINKQRLEMARLDFSNSLSTQSIREIFYRQPYYKVVQDMPELINTIKRNSEVSRVKNLKKYATENKLDIDFYVSSEAGITNSLGEWIDINCVVIEDSKGFQSIGTSQGFPIPEKYTEEIKQTELGKVMDKIFSGKDLGKGKDEK